MYKSKLDGAKPIEFRIHEELAAPDCGGEDYDKVEYIPVCPTCGRNLSYGGLDRFCRDCGQKLYWKVSFPRFNE